MIKANTEVTLYSYCFIFFVLWIKFLNALKKSVIEKQIKKDKKKLCCEILQVFTMYKFK